MKGAFLGFVLLAIGMSSCRQDMCLSSISEHTFLTIMLSRSCQNKYTA